MPDVLRCIKMTEKNVKIKTKESQGNKKIYGKEKEKEKKFEYQNHRNCKKL